MICPPTNRPLDTLTCTIVYPTNGLLWCFTIVTLQPCNFCILQQFNPAMFYYHTTLNCKKKMFYYCDIWLCNVLILWHFDPILYVQEIDVHPASRGGCHVTVLAKCGQFVRCHQWTPGSVFARLAGCGWNVTMFEIKARACALTLPNPWYGEAHPKELFLNMCRWYFVGCA